MNIGFCILGYGIGVFLAGVLLWIPDTVDWVKDKIKERKEQKERKKRAVERLEKFRENNGWLPIDE